MPCFHPNRVWKTDSGILFYNPYKDNRQHTGFLIPCGQCVGCRAKRTREWAIRILHEASLQPENSFITLTYDNEHLPNPPQLVKKHFQDFIRSLRDKNRHKTIRYYHCGEYGEKLGRPHYHAIIFNHSFSDKLKLNGHKDLYTSNELSATWQRGYASIGMVTPESAAYVANYIQKKILGKNAFRHYKTDDGEPIQSEYSTMSLKPGIAHDWYLKHKSDCFPSDFITIKGNKLPIPKYYTRLYEITNPVEMAIIKQKREAHFEKNKEEFTPKRLAVKKQVMKARMSRYKRNLPNKEL
jgi:hypothetical protein